MKTVFEKKSTPKIAKVTASIGIGIFILALIVRFLLETYVYSKEKQVVPVRAPIEVPTSTTVPQVPAMGPTVDTGFKVTYFALKTTPTVKIAVDAAGGEDYRVATIYSDFDYRLHTNVRPEGELRKAGMGTNVVEVAFDPNVTHVWLSVDNESDSIRQVVFRKFPKDLEPKPWWDPNAR